MYTRKKKRNRNFLIQLTQLLSGHLKCCSHNNATVLLFRFCFLFFFEIILIFARFLCSMVRGCDRRQLETPTRRIETFYSGFIKIVACQSSGYIRLFLHPSLLLSNSSFSNSLSLSHQSIIYFCTSRKRSHHIFICLSHLAHLESNFLSEFKFSNLWLF